MVFIHDGEKTVCDDILLTKSGDIYVYKNKTQVLSFRGISTYDGFQVVDNKGEVIPLNQFKEDGISTQDLILESTLDHEARLSLIEIYGGI